ncbi:hypothetical protein ACIQUB_22345 [Rhizobium sp. NPDC090275]|uniref:hypothetical protein n=1 Tax=Rhizobium sp. NPDC090275 TaxID=3364498 RepID=UPI003839FED8
MVPDALPQLMAVRFVILTPFVVACVFIVRRWPNARLYDALTVTAAVLSTTLPMIPDMRSTSEYLFVYQTYNSAAFLYFVVSLRPPGCIRAVADCIRLTLGVDAFVFRFGGEEVLILVDGTDPLHAMAFAERICAAIEGLRNRASRQRIWLGHRNHWGRLGNADGHCIAV